MKLVCLVSQIYQSVEEPIGPITEGVPCGHSPTRECRQDWGAHNSSAGYANGGAPVFNARAKDSGSVSLSAPLVGEMLRCRSLAPTRARIGQRYRQDSATFTNFGEAVR